MNSIHFIAIGGSAMHNLALALHLKGYRITGSDDEIFEPARSRLAQHELLPEEEGWFPQKLSQDVDAVILGMHAKGDNPELQKARELGLPIYSYPEFLYSQSVEKKRIVIAGSHGKTTITGMVLHVMQRCGMDTDYMVGARLEGFDIMVRLSDEAPYMVFEGDEYLTSPLDPRPKFHLYRPHIALITGIAWDHINVFKTFDDYVEQFRQFIRLIEPGGALVYCSDDILLDKLCRAERPDLGKYPYQLPDFRRKGDANALVFGGVEYPVGVFGKHNMLNIRGAWTVCNLLGISDEDFLAGIGGFRGAANRLECLAKNETTTVFKDFAHAPSKVGATLRAVREQYPQRKLVACLELHTYSSLSRDFLTHYAHTLDAADEAIVYFNPHALSLKRLPMLDPEEIRKGFARKDLQVSTDAAKMVADLSSAHWENSCLLFMSSGNFDGTDLDALAGRIMSQSL